jgi:ABC-type phosphate/phosphonate transport system substrate-binding protein
MIIVNAKQLKNGKWKMVETSDEDEKIFIELCESCEHKTADEAMECLKKQGSEIHKGLEKAFGMTISREFITQCLFENMCKELGFDHEKVTANLQRQMMQEWREQKLRTA